MKRSGLSHVVTSACLAAALTTAAACDSVDTRKAIPGAELYRACETCHGSAGEGNVTLGAPKLAGLPAWYVAEQLVRFKNNTRGKHPDDVEGLRMRAMARQMLSDAEVAAVATHVAQMTIAPTAPTLSRADASQGQPLYLQCAACHGMRGEGNEQLKAPPLQGLDDWYVASQLRKFQTGVRGTAPGDDLGAQMQAMASIVDAAAVDDLAAYVHTLSK